MISLAFLDAYRLILTNMLARIKYTGPKADAGPDFEPPLRILTAGPLFPCRIAEKAQKLTASFTQICRKKGKD
jgi:hypothetical protein